MKSRNIALTGAVIFTLLVGFAWSCATDLIWSGKMALLIFSSAIAAWTLSTLDATLIALAAALAMWAAGLLGDSKVLAGLGDPFIAFVIAGFMLGGAYKTSGLSERMARWFAGRSRHVGQLFYWLTTVLVLLSFVVPSTSARAALLMPIYVAVANAAGDNPRIKKALAILFPTIIVLSCVTSYLGAGANLIAADFIARFSGERISYLHWLLLGGPLGLISCYASTWVILKVFLNAQERSLPFYFSVAEPATAASVAAQRKVMAATVLLMVLWGSEGWHGLDAGMVTLGVVVLLCLPAFGALSFKQALKEVEWSLVVFMAATLDLSKGLIDSGLVQYAMNSFSTATKGWAGNVILILLLAVALLSHLLIHSRTARAAVLLPVLIPLGAAAGHSSLLVAFFANAAMGYCLTLPVCAKPVAMFSTAGGDGYGNQDLFRLSAWLLPLHLLLFVLAFWVYGQLM